MQTFLPFAGFQSCAFYLDDKRLNKQIVEAWQIMTGRVPNANHPACLMWKGREVELGAYAYECCLEYWRRYKKHGLNDKIRDLAVSLNDGYIVLPCRAYFPEVLHISHRVNLLRKDHEYYRNFLQSYIPSPDLSTYPTGYYWPVEPVGKKAKADRAAWIAWAEKNGVEV